MHDGKLTDKEWEILHYFIGNEGYGPESANVNGIKGAMLKDMSHSYRILRRSSET